MYIWNLRQDCKFTPFNFPLKFTCTFCRVKFIYFDRPVESCAQSWLSKFVSYPDWSIGSSFRSRTRCMTTFARCRWTNGTASLMTLQASAPSKRPSKCYILIQNCGIFWLKITFPVAEIKKLFFMPRLTKVSGAYSFCLVRPSVRLSVCPSVCTSHFL